MPPTQDALGRSVAVPESPRRIVSLVPSLTELLVHLGLTPHLAGVTRFCVHPPDLRDAKPTVGGTKNVDVDALRALNPDLILANKEENEPADVEAISTFAPVFVTDVATVEDALDMIRTVGRLTGRADLASSTADEIAARFDALPSYAPIRAAYFIWREPYMAVGGDTFIHDVMARGGFTNVTADRTRYPELSLDALADLDPDVLLCASEPFPFHQKDRFTADLRTALPNTPLHLVDGELFSWYGSRLLQTPGYLSELRRGIGGIG